MRIVAPHFLAVLVAVCAAYALARSACAADNEWRSVAGPVSARIVRIIDGDTVVVDAHPWPGHAVRVSVRLRGIDAPEIHSRCPAVREAGQRAREALATLLGGEDRVDLHDISGGKYYGRVLAAISNRNGELAPILLARGFVRPYSGGARVKPPCPAS